MDFLAFNIQSYQRPYIRTKLISDDSKFRRGFYRKEIKTVTGYFLVRSENIFEFSNDSILFIHGRDRSYDDREQRATVRNFIQYNTALVIVNKCMKVNNS